MQIRVLTWNLFGLEERHLDERTEAACLAMLLRTPQPDVVFLQEVVRRSWHGHLRHHFRAAGFTPFPADPTTTPSGYFVVAFTGPRLRDVTGALDPLPSTRMGRELLALRATCEGRPVQLLTAHLESLREGRRERGLQLGHVARILRESDVPALFAGDTNLRDEELVDVDLTGVADAWESLGRPPALRDTWTLPGGTARARFDRFYVRGLRVVSQSFVGDRPYGVGRERPSDHVGVEVVVAVDDER